MTAVTGEVEVPHAGPEEPSRPGRGAAPRRRRGRVAVAALLVAGSAATAVVLPDAARADDISARQQRVEAALHAAGADMDRASAATQQASAALQAVETQLAGAQRRLASARGALAGAQATADVTRKNADAARVALSGAQRREAAAAAAADAQQSGIDALARERYEIGPSESVSTLIGAGGAPASYLDRAGLLQMVARERDTRLAALRDARARQAADRAVVADRARDVETQDHAAQAAVARVQQLVNQASTAEQDTARLTAARAGVLRQAESTLAQDKARVSVLQKESADIAALIRQREIAAEAAAAAAAAAAARQRAAAPTAPGPAAPVSSAGLIYPVNGPITSGFGYRKDPYTEQYALHAGIDFGVDAGTPIKAAKAGVVIFAGQETGYGNYTCIEHGGGFSTCYAHQAAIDVTVGQTVSQGQIIGLVGSTGYSTGPHLHFETRVNGNPVDPMQYF